MRKFTLPLMAVCALFAIGAPLALATSSEVRQNRKISRNHGKILAAQESIRLLRDIDAGLRAAILRNVDGLEALQAKVSAVVAAATTALTKIQTALEDPVTGLRALNLARPKFAIVSTSGSGATVAGSTPGFVGAGRVETGVYILDFGQDVSKRAAQLSINTPGRLTPGPYGASFIGQILNCGASASAAAACDPFTGGAGTSTNSQALVNIENASTLGGATGGRAADNATFTATEIAG